MKINFLKKIDITFVHLLLLGGVILTITPFLWMLSTSLKESETIFTYPPKFIPEKITFEHYQRLFGIEPQHIIEKKGRVGLHFFLYLKNSIIVAVLITFISIFFNSLAAFAFAKFRFKGRDKIFTILLTTLMIPGQMTMIPVFLLLRNLGLLNSYFGLIIPAAANVYGIFLIRQFMLTIPDELIESAIMDGCSYFKIFWEIVLPLCKPILAALCVFTFIGAWNDFLWPLIVMMKESMYTLPVALANLSGEYATEYGLLLAGAVVVVAPIIIIFIVAQRFIIESLAHTGIKG